MLSFSIIDKPLEKLKTGNKIKYNIKPLMALKEELNVAKLPLDKLWNDEKFVRLWKRLDPYLDTKNIIPKLGNTINVTNAWMKCYELITYYDLIPQDANSFIHFDNAAFPGSFIVAAHHYAKTIKNINNYKWYGSSLLSPTEQTSGPLQDLYNLYKNYQSNWLCDKDNNGDVLILENQLLFNKKLGGKVDLYTSDLGFGVESNYKEQESIHFCANVGQILTGLLTLKKGGCFITKQYTAFESNTVSVIYIVASFFDEFYICKPATSRAPNSEIYLVGKKFKGGVYLKHPYIMALFNILNDCRQNKEEPLPLFDPKSYPKWYLPLIVKINKEIFSRQIDALNSNIYIAEEKNRIGEKLVKTRNDMQDKWLSENPILPILPSDKLNMVNTYNQGW